MPGQRIKLRDRLNFIAEELDSDAFFVCGTGIHFDDVAAHSKSAARKIHIVAFVQHFDQTARSEEHTSELQSQSNLVCRLLLEKKNSPGLLRWTTFKSA